MAHAVAVGFGSMDAFERRDGLERIRRRESVGGVEGSQSVGGWRCAHERLVALAAERAGLDFEEGCWLLQAFRSGAHAELGCGSFNEYTERLFGYSARLTREKLRVAEALEELPQMAGELETAAMSFSAVRELTRVAVAGTEREWLDAARGRTVREVEALVSGRRQGSRPGDAPDMHANRHVLRLEVSGETLATFREAMAELRRSAGEALDDDSAILQLCRGVLGSSRDEGCSSYQLALTICERCGAGKQQGRGELVAVTREVVEMAHCDAQQVGHIDGRDCAHVGEIDGVSGVGRHDGHVQPSDDADAGRVETTRASQTLPPALRRRVLRRDGGRCQVSGCRHATFVDVHHLRFRSEGGANTLENLVTLCGAHHRAIHAGKLVSEGTPAHGLTFRHADGTAYGGVLARGYVDLRAKACGALVHLGFRESEAKRAVAKISSRANGSVEALVREALRELTRS